MRNRVLIVGVLLSAIPKCHSRRTSFESHNKIPERELWSYTSSCSFDEGGNVFVSSTFGRDDIGFGQNITSPYASIQFAVDRREPCQTIYIMEGVYRNSKYDKSDINNAVVRLDGVHDLRITNYNDDCVVIQFDGAGGIVGGSSSNPISNIEISGIEIIGPNEQISFKEAFANRLLSMKRYKGRGIAIWSGHHIYIHNVIVHHCPGSGIRVNKGDYVKIENSEVYSNTWWSSAAESAIVLAESVSIDEYNSVKMIISGNIVYDNINKIPYYNKNYEWDYSPISGNLNCSSHTGCREGSKSDCPWQCQYGKEMQDYIVDGSGVYVTRNNQSYLYGKFELSNNVCYKNGINGLVMHRTNRGVITNNIIYENGVVPRLDKPEQDPLDWHEGCAGKSRQPYSGLVLNNAQDVKLRSNLVTSRYEDDYAFIQISDNDNLFPLLAGGNNHVCKGKSSMIPTNSVKFNSNPKKCIPEFESMVLTNHSCRKYIKYADIRCGDSCDLINWPHTRYASYKASNAKEKCSDDCDKSNCIAFSLQMDMNNQKGNRICTLYSSLENSTLNRCVMNPFNTYNCSKSTIDGQFFIYQDDAKQYDVQDTHV